MDFALLVLYSIMFKVCGIIGVSKIEFVSLFGTEKVKAYRNLGRHPN